MVKPIFISSLAERAGKSFIAIGIMKKLQNDGKKVAYFKPIGVTNYEDSKSSIDVSQVMGIAAPISLPENYYVDLVDVEKKEEYLSKIKSSYDELAEIMDYIIIEGCGIRKFTRVGLDDITIAKLLGINEIILIETNSSDIIIDNLFFSKYYFESKKMKIKGVIFNKIDYDYIARIKELEENHINRYDIPILGIIENEYELSAPRVSEIQEAIGGHLLNEQSSEGLNNLVQTYMIGAMNTSSALKHLRKAEKCAVITGGDRAGLILATLNEADASCLILTGFIQPDVNIITAANEKGIPLILSPSDTYTTMRNLQRIKPAVQIDEINLAIKLVEDLDWKILLK